MKELNIFEYSDYRAFLADFYKTKKASNPRYSYRVFSRDSGIGSPSHFSMVVNAERNLSHKTLEKYTQGLGLKGTAKKYFDLLVKYNQSESLEQKALYMSEILKFKSKARVNSLDHKKFSFLSNWYVVAIYVLIDTSSFVNDKALISKKLKSEVTPAQVEGALKLLEDLGMIKKDPIKGYVQTDGAITVADNTRKAAVFNYHTDMMKLAYKALRTEPIQKREMNGVTICLPLDKVDAIKEKIREFRREINKISSSFEHTDEVYQMNIQFFSLTKGNVK